jgi:hypothetical protein
VRAAPAFGSLFREDAPERHLEPRDDPDPRDVVTYDADVDANIDDTATPELPIRGARRLVSD